MNGLQLATINETDLEVRPSNIPAVEFYQKLGFQVIGQRPEYYTDSKEDALLMMKVLSRKVPKLPKIPHRGVGPYGPEAKVNVFYLVYENRI